MYWGIATSVTNKMQDLNDPLINNKRETSCLTNDNLQEECQISYWYITENMQRP